MSKVLKSIELSTGVTLEFYEQGSPKGIPVIFLHGMGDSWRSFEQVFPYLPEDYRVIAPTQRGHGNSSKPEEEYSYSHFASDIAALMDALNIDTAIVVGHSSGSSHAKRFALDYPERTLGLVLISSFSDVSKNPSDVELWDEVISKMEDPLNPDLLRELQEDTISGEIPQQFFETIVKESLKVPARVWKAIVLRDLEEDMSVEQGKIKAPVLILWGNQDTGIPRSEQDLQVKTIPNSNLLIYEGAGHSLHWEEPERFAADLVNFIENIRPDK